MALDLDPIAEGVVRTNGRGSEEFDIVATYKKLLATDPDLTMPVAAIEALVLLLSHSSTTTISETMDLLNSATTHLKHSIPNPISLSAGTDLFLRYLVTTLNGTRGLGFIPGGVTGDFQAIRHHLVSNGRLFVKRAKESRTTIGGYAQNFIRDESVVLTNGGSRVVGAVLRAAAEARSNSVRFKVIYVQSSTSTSNDIEGDETIRSLRELGVPVAVIPDAAVAYSLGKVSMVLVGAEGVVENGGIISRMGTYQVGLLAKSASKPFLVVVESHKFVRLYPLGQYDLPVEQKILDFTTESPSTSTTIIAAPVPGFKRDDSTDTPAIKERSGYFEESPAPKKTTASNPAQSGSDRMLANTGPLAVDYTPPNLITALITESGVHTPSAVSEELIKLWY
ncbi:translation initiation factor eIF-2B subunit alpha [Agyrium rufum]|nr:translation initiation factor eIF-2B subunit alpha [Agyrium rufum]